MATILTEVNVDYEMNEMFVHCTDAHSGITMRIMVPMDALNEETQRSIVKLSKNMPEAFLQSVMMIAEGPDGD